MGVGGGDLPKPAAALYMHGEKKRRWWWAVRALGSRQTEARKQREAVSVAINGNGHGHGEEGEGEADGVKRHDETAKEVATSSNSSRSKNTSRGYGRTGKRTRGNHWFGTGALEQRRHLFLHSFVTHGQSRGRQRQGRRAGRGRRFLLLLSVLFYGTAKANATVVRFACSWQRQTGRREEHSVIAVAIRMPWLRAEVHAEANKRQGRNACSPRARDHGALHTRRPLGTGTAAAAASRTGTGQQGATREREREKG